MFPERLLNKLDADKPRVGPHNFALALDAAVFEKRQSEDARQVRQWTSNGKARAAV